MEIIYTMNAINKISKWTDLNIWLKIKHLSTQTGDEIWLGYLMQILEKPSQCYTWTDEITCTG